MEQDHMIWLIKQLNIVLDQDGREKLRQGDLTPSQSFVLHYLLSQADCVMYATELHTKLGISKAAVSSVLKGLKRNGYLEMRAVCGDDRKKKIVPTQKAYLAQVQIEKRLTAQQARLCLGLSEDDLQRLEVTLYTMITNLKSEHTRRNGNDKNTA